MAQAAHATTAGIGGYSRPEIGGLFARLRTAAAASAERSRQRRELAGYAGIQEIGRQTGTRG